MKEEIKVTITKCPIPLIWLDTSVLINMTRRRLGKVDGRNNYSREGELFEAISQAVQSKKLLCPQGDQQEEIMRPTKEFYVTQSLLSQGLQFLHRSEIKEAQMLAAMMANIYKTQHIAVNCLGALEPVSLCEFLIPQKYRIDVYSNKTDRRIQRDRIQKSNNLEAFSQLKKSLVEKKITFDEQLQVELSGDYQCAYEICRYMDEVLSQREFPTETKQSQIGYLLELADGWDALGGNPPRLVGLLQFLQSPEWQFAPWNVVSAHLYAKVMTKSGEIRSGDPMDINQLVVALIYCDYVVCDKTMRNLIREMELDKRYNVKVYSIADSEQIIREINAL